MYKISHNELFTICDTLRLISYVSVFQSLGRVKCNTPKSSMFTTFLVLQHYYEKTVNRNF